MIDIGQARPTVHESFMQRMAEVLRSMTNLNSPNVASPPSSVESPSLEPPFAVAADNVAPTNSIARGEVNSREEIDFVTYESLGRSENQPEQLENMDGDVDDGSGNYSDYRNDAFPPFRNRQDSEQSSNGFPLLRFVKIPFYWFYLVIKEL